jgi:putative cell wall-binding protein
MIVSPSKVRRSFVGGAILAFTLLLNLALVPVAAYATDPSDDPGWLAAQNEAQVALQSEKASDPNPSDKHESDIDTDSASPADKDVRLFGIEAQAAVAGVNGGDFNAGNLISDANFYAGSTWSESDVQSFLNQKVPTCRDKDHTCLKDYTQTTRTMPANVNCAAYAGAANERAARIIAKVGAACGISQKVLLVLLQKEQSLVTDTWPTPDQYRKATGYACPDTSTCDAEFNGFFNQVYHAARQYKLYGTSSTFTWFPVGKTTNIAYSPKGSCGEAPVTIWNKATAALYYYTPFQPNAAAMKDLHGDGDTCSAYGNRNFWTIYTGWFGSTTTGSVPALTRTAGADRYATSVEISKATYPNSKGQVAYIATGANYPDALGAAPAAVKQGGPLLLVDPNVLPTSVAAELKRLAPSKIVVIGGTSAVSTDVTAKLTAIQPNVVRVNGVDRFDTSRKLATFAFGVASDAYIATGSNFPDALSAGAAGGSLGAPVILVNGAAASVDAATSTALRDLGVSRATIVGGTSAITAKLEASLKKSIATVTRIAGTDRFDTSAKLNRAAFTRAPRVFLATGLAFPDALAGAAWAGAADSPLYVVPSNCVPAFISNAVFAYSPPTVTLLGGPNALGSGAVKLSPCRG